ncbi:transcription factor SAC51-like [Carex rostrata]
MERDFLPGCNAPNLQWEYASNFTPPLIPQNGASVLLPIYGDQYGYSAATLNGYIPFAGFQPFELYPSGQCYNLSPSPLYNLPTAVNYPSQTVNMDPDPVNPVWDIPVSNQTNVNGTVDGTESEMHEDTEEIDALLYSDSDEYIIEEEPSTGQSPMKYITGEEVASTTIHAKKRRLGIDLDASLIDTATSAKDCDYNNNNNVLDCSDAESSCVGGGEERETLEGEERESEGISEKSDCIDMNLKRKKIQETVCLLRRIIPGGKGKDAATILDEAISYLKSLKLKAKALGNF